MLYLTIHLHPILHTTQLDFPGLYLCEALAAMLTHTNPSQNSNATTNTPSNETPRRHTVSYISLPLHPTPTAIPLVFKCALHQLFKL
jgi:hypothetical protein